MLEKGPHKSTWKTRKKQVDDDSRIPTKQQERSLEVRETLEKVKKYSMILCAVLGIWAILAVVLGGWFFYLSPFIMIIVLFIGVFFIYFPISDELKKRETENI